MQQLVHCPSARAQIHGSFHRFGGIILNSFLFGIFGPLSFGFSGEIILKVFQTNRAALQPDFAS